MPAPAPQKLPIPLPKGGIDRSSAFAEQPPGTTANSLNVRSADILDRMRIGKRGGHSRAFIPRAGTEDARRTLGMIPLALPTGVPVTGAGSFETVTDTFSAYAAGAATDLLGKYVVFRRAPASASNVLTVGGHYTIDTVPNRMTITPVAANTAYWTGINYATTNDVEITCRAQATISNDFQCTRYVIALRGSDDFTNYIKITLTHPTTDRVAIQVSSQTGAVNAVIGTSANIILEDTTAPASTTFDDLNIRAYATADSIVVEVAWPTKAPQDSQWNGVTFTQPTTLFAGNDRAAFGYEVAGVTNGAILSAAYTRVIPPSPTVTNQVNGTDTDSPLTDRYLTPTGWTSFALTALNANTQVVGPSATAAAPLRMVIDQTSDHLDGESANVSTASAGLRPSAAPGTAELAVEGLYKVPTTATNSDLTALFRLLLDGSGVERSMLKATLNITTAGTASTSGISQGITLKLYAVVNGVITQIGGTNTCNINVGLADYLRLVDTGTNIEVQHHGLTILNVNYAGVAAYTSSGAAAALADATRVGFDAPASSSDLALNTVRLIDVGSAAASAIGEYTSRVLILSAGIAQHGRLDQPGTLTTATGIGIYNALPIGFSFNAKWYVVDGDLSKIVDPSANTCVDWTASAGTFPAGCRLACLYRGRAVLARQASNASIWYMARSLNPRDFDVGASPVSTSAAAGSDPKIGLPGDAITALIPFNDDLLLFGCATSIYMMEGDPGYKGAIQNVTDQIGVTGPRAWCFDELGNLYFLGPKGLYRLLRGQLDPQQVDGGRLPDLLDQVNLDTTLIQLVYDKAQAEVRIFLTPVDGVTIGTHVVFGTRTNTLFPDKLPLFFGPWAVCSIAGPEDEDRRFLLGCDDGFVRRPLESARKDDADENGVDQAIDSWVEIGPFELSAGDVEAIATEINAMIGANTTLTSADSTGGVLWYWFTAPSPEELADQTFGEEVASGVWGSTRTGFQPPTGLRQRGGSHKIRMRQTSATAYWSIERVWAMIQARSRRR